MYMYLSVECFIVISSHQGLLTNRNVLLCYTITILTLILFPVFITFMYRPGAGTHTHTHDYLFRPEGGELTHTHTYLFRPEGVHRCTF